MAASSAARRCSVAWCCGRFRLNECQPGHSSGHVATPSPAMRNRRSGHQNARWPGEWPGAYSTSSGPNASPVREQLVHRTGNMLRPAKPEPELERNQPQRLPRPDADGLRAAIAADDVCLPLVPVQPRAARLHERRHPAEMRTMRVRDRDPSQVLGALAELPDRLEQEPAVGLEQRVHERELAAVVDQERVGVPSLAVAETVDAG